MLPPGAIAVAGLVSTLRPPPARIVIPVPQAAPIVQFVPQPPMLAQAGGALDQSAWLHSAMDLAAFEVAVIDRIGRGS